jgi:hypothetical protein
MVFRRFAVLVAMLFVLAPPARSHASFFAEGQGGFVGTVHYAGSGLPLVSPCAQNSFTLTATGATFHVDLAVVAYVGPVTITAVGSPWSCETYASPAISWGWMTVSVRGTGPTGSTVHCTASDDYSREGSYLGWSAYDANVGTCTVNGYTSPTNMGISLVLLPSGTGSIVDSAAPGQLATGGTCPWNCP